MYLTKWHIPPLIGIFAFVTGKIIVVSIPDYSYSLIGWFLMFGGLFGVLCSVIVIDVISPVQTKKI